MESFSRLHPHVQHAIVHDLGWRSLRPVQEMAVEAVLDGANAVVLAPTAGGKTEAAIFPVLSRIVGEQLRPVSALYICPIRALLNNQEERLGAYGRMVGLDVFKWHGDVSDSRKQSFRRRPSHLLMSTPESLEVMMISERTDARALFESLSVVIIDEVHAFAGDDRGAHLAALLERLAAMAGRDIQRIGLSATVGNPGLIGEWMQGSSERPLRVIDPPRDKARRRLSIDFCDELEEAALGISRLCEGKKSLIFVESRSKAERVAQALSSSVAEVFIHHSSVSRAERALSEAQFARGQNTAIVCTSTMELGIDVGDLDQVIQIDAPSTVASFLQRIGRTGRRPGTQSNCRFFCLSPEALLQSVAISRLAESGWVEDVVPAAQAMHVLAHQAMALTLQEGGISRHRLMDWVEAAYPFYGIRPERVQELVNTMVARDILYEAEGLLTLGRRGEKLYGRRHFFDLYAVFTAPSVMRVQHGKDDVGYVQALFVSMHDFSQGPLCFRLSGRAWESGLIDWGKGIVHVRPAERGRVPTWLGIPGNLSWHISQAMMEVLLREGEEQAWLSPLARQELGALRESYAGMLECGTAPLEDGPEGIIWHTFAGGRINRLLSAGMEKLTGKRWIAGNLSLRCADISGTAAREGLSGLSTLNWEEEVKQAARGMARGMVSKFQPCLSEEAEDRLLSERLLDLGGTLHFLRTVKIGGMHLTLRSVGTRLREDETGGVLHLAFERLVPRVEGKHAGPRNEIEWVDTPASLRNVCESLMGETELGLDVETALDFTTLYLIQVATRARNFLIDPFGVLDLSPLQAVMGAKRPIKLIHNARFERRVLIGVGLCLEGVIDTMELSRQRRVDVLGGHSLSAVCERELGIVIDKSSQTSDWSRRPLSSEQVSYAALDAEVLLRLGDVLRRGGV